MILRNLILTGRALARRPVTLARRLHIYPYGFCGAYPSWEAASEVAGGSYDSSLIAARTLRSTLKLIERLESGKQAPAIASVRLGEALVLASESTPTEELHVLDFGGALGHHFLLVRDLLPPAVRVTWTVWETPSMCRVGKSAFPASGIEFVSSASDLKGEYSLVHASASLQYLENPWETLRTLRKLGMWMMVDRLPLLEGPDDRLTIQHVPPWIYRASYPAWFLSSERWGAVLGSELERTWDSGERVWLEGRPIADRGFLWSDEVFRRKARSSNPMKDSGAVDTNGGAQGRRRS